MKTLSLFLITLTCFAQQICSGNFCPPVKKGPQNIALISISVGGAFILGSLLLDRDVRSVFKHQYNAADAAKDNEALTAYATKLRLKTVTSDLICLDSNTPPVINLKRQELQRCNGTEIFAIPLTIKDGVVRMKVER